jgi:hypothetical protein
MYVMFTSAVVAKRRVPAATWSSIWYMLSSFAVISYTENWVLRTVCRGRIVDRRVCIDDIPAPASRWPAGRRRAGVGPHAAPVPIAHDGLKAA